MLEDKIIKWVEAKLNGKVTVEKEEYGDVNEVFKIKNSNDNFFLKIGSSLKKEADHLQWLNGKLPVPKVIDFTKEGEKEILLLSAIEGKNLALLCKEWPAEKVVDKLVEALKKFHAIKAKDCPFGTFTSNKVLIHGDACLPNFIYKDDKFSGYIDLGDMAVANPEIDYAAAVWSLQYNLGHGYGSIFLEKIGVKNVTEELTEKLRLQYEDIQKQWGL